MTQQTIATTHDDLAEPLSRVMDEGEPVVLKYEGQPVAVLVSMEEYAAFRRWEDQMDLEAVRRSKEEPGAAVLWEDLKAELGME